MNLVNMNNVTSAMQWFKLQLYAFKTGKQLNKFE